MGPKTALAILSGASVSELASAIASRDAKRISAIKGVGKKTAEKICVELRDKVGALAFGADDPASPMRSGVAADAVTALRALGFGDEASAKMVSDVLAKNPDADDVEKVIKLALASR